MGLLVTYCFMKALKLYRNFQCSLNVSFVLLTTGTLTILKYKIQKGSVPSQIVLNNSNAVVYWNNEIVTKETKLN